MLNRVVFQSAETVPDVKLSHNVIYVRTQEQAEQEAALQESTADTDVVVTENLYENYIPSLAQTGGVVASDVVISDDTILEKGLIVCGKLTVAEGTTLVVRKGGPVVAQSAEFAGHILFEAGDYGFKPGHVVGPDADLDPEFVYIAGHTDFTAKGTSVTGTGVNFYTNSADMKADAVFTGMIFYDRLIVRRGVTLTSKDGCWLNWIHAELEDNVTFKVSETEICVLEYIHTDKGGGYYNHTGFGTTKIGKNVKLIGDDTFCWFWMGDLDGRFADVRGTIVMKAKQLVQVNPDDLDNFETSEITGSGTTEDPYRMTFHEKDTNRSYVTGRKLSMDAAVNNRVQDKFPDCVLFDYWEDEVNGHLLKRVLGFRSLRAGNILIHKMDDVESLVYFADEVVYAEEC
ncbi:MAG: hypothetical protein IJV14_03685 [Lachnospiraceae bacterium]|nr:hypothetical protein [Lachnospiraceae bacterium]